MEVFIDGVWCSWRKRFKLPEHRASIDNIQRLSYQVIITLTTWFEIYCIPFSICERKVRVGPTQVVILSKPEERTCML